MAECICLVWEESERAVAKRNALTFGRDGCLFQERSAKTNMDMEQCFEELLLKLHSQDLGP